MCACGNVNTFCTIADGVDACIRATREELRQGAHCIKIMGSGGVGSPTDPIRMYQYREDEISAIVGEATERRAYVTAHCHPASAVRRCVEYGVRSIEHGTLIDEETAAFVAAHGAYVVPTMATIFALKEAGPRLGFPAVSQQKMEVAFAAALSGMDIMKKAGVKLGLGTDLLGELYVQECREFTIRREVFSPVEILRQATSINAEMMQQAGRLGCIAPGAAADLLVVDGDPLADIGCIAEDGKHLRAVVRKGELVRNELR
jgi:imidazolonepropionase-like amidohydrolase